MSTSTREIRGKLSRTCLKCGESVKGDIALRLHLRNNPTCASNYSSTPTDSVQEESCQGEVIIPDTIQEQSLIENEDHITSSDPEILPAPQQAETVQIVACVCHICGDDFEDESVLQAHIQHHLTGSLDDGENDENPIPSESENSGEVADTAIITAKKSKPGVSTDVSPSIKQRGRKRKYYSSEDSIYECEVCNKVYTSYDSLRYHRRNHEEKTLQCKHCSKLFRFSHTLKLHERIHTGEKSYLCEVCGKGFSFKHNMMKHVRDLHEGQPPTHLCDTCGRGFNCKSHLDVHKKRHLNSKGPIYAYRDKNRKKMLEDNILDVIKQHVYQVEQPPYTCKTCSKDKVYPAWRNLVLHIQRVHIGLPLNHICSHCGKKFDSRGHLVLHERVHSGETPYACTFCPKTFPGPGNLASHLRVHTKERPYACTICTKTFAQSSVRNRHVRVHLGIKPHTCELCKKSFATRHHLTRHELMHTKERSFCCEFCGKRFAYSYNLDSHRRIHTGDTPYKCPKCDRSFIRSNELVRHLRTHEEGGEGGEQKRFCCEICGDLFEEGAKLKRHLRTHESGGGKKQTKDRSFKHVNTRDKIKNRRCTICKQVFEDEGELAAHVLTHDNDKPHACTRCNRRFKKENALHKHVNSVHKEAVETLCFICQICSQEFNTDTAISDHMREEHGVDTTDIFPQETDAERDLRNSKIDELISAVTAVTEGLKGSGKKGRKPRQKRVPKATGGPRKTRQSKRGQKTVEVKIEDDEGEIENLIEISQVDDTVMTIYYDSDNVDQMPAGVSEIVVIESSEQPQELGENDQAIVEEVVAPDYEEVTIECPKEDEQVISDPVADAELLSNAMIQEVIGAPDIGEGTGESSSSYRCDSCSQDFESYDTLITHMFTHASEESFIVKIMDGDAIKIILTDKIN